MLRTDANAWCSRGGERWPPGALGRAGPRGGARARLPPRRRCHARGLQRGLMHDCCTPRRPTVSNASSCACRSVITGFRAPDFATSDNLGQALKQLGIQ